MGRFTALAVLVAVLGTAAGCSGAAESLVRAPPWPPSLLDLEDAQRVLPRVDDERCPGEPDVGDAVLGLQTRHVVVLDLDTAGPKLCDLSTYVLDEPRCLRLRVRRPRGALSHGQLGAAATPEHDGRVTLVQDLQAKLVVVEVSSGAKISRQQHRMDYMLSKHRYPHFCP